MAKTRYDTYPAGRVLSYLDMRVETENCTVINSDLTICNVKDPIVIYSTRNTKDTSNNFNYGFVKKTDNNSGYIEYIDIYQSYQDSISMYRMQCLTWSFITVIFIILLYLLRAMILKLEHSINSMELCLKKIYGMPLFIRYESISVGSLLSFILGITAAVLLLRYFEIESYIAVIIIAFIMIIGEMMMNAFEIRRWEKMQTIKILKGGCL